MNIKRKFSHRPGVPFQLGRREPARRKFSYPPALASVPVLTLVVAATDAEARRLLDEQDVRGCGASGGCAFLSRAFWRAGKACSRHEVRRRTAGLAHPSGRDLDDLATQAADDALVAILGKLDQFRGDALFSTWARRFATLEAPGEIRRRLGHTREAPTDSEQWLSDRVGGDDPEQLVEARELARSVGRLISTDLTPHQREVLLSLTIEETSAKALAARLDSTPGALYKTLHDARRKLRAGLTPRPADRHEARQASTTRRAHCRRSLHRAVERVEMTSEPTAGGAAIP